MKKVIKASREFNNVEKYIMMLSPEIRSGKDLEDGEKFTVEGYLVFTDEKEDGSEVEVMSILTTDKKVYSFQSSTLRRSIEEIWEVMEGKPFTAVKTSGKTRAGRDYINCYLDTDGLI